MGLKMNARTLVISVVFLLFPTITKPSDEITNASPVIEAVEVYFPESPKIKRGANGFVPISTHTIHEGIIHEDQQVVLRKTAFLIHKFSNEKGFEACARMCVGNADGHRVFGMRVLTTYSQIACLQPADPEKACPSGFNVSSSGVRIHPHPPQERVRLNSVDASLRSGLRRGMLVHTEPFWFSSRDLMNGPGYLVTPNQLLYFDGEDYFSWNKHGSAWEPVVRENE